MKKMKKSLSGSVAVLMLLGYNGFGANWQSEYWIAHRTDTNNGDGSLANPYNGTGDGYDTNLLYNIPAKSTIHILPGTYQTHGFGQYQITNGFAFKDGWNIQGSGVDKTIIQLVDANSDFSNSSGFNYVFYSGDSGAKSNMSVLDLTIDCNYAGVAATKGLTNLTLHGIGLWGHHSRIERVKVINAAGLRNKPPLNPEAFILFLGQFDASYPATGLLIRDCEVSSFVGGECSAISFIGSGGSIGTSGTVQNNRVALSFPTAGGGQFAYNVGCTPNGIIFENNFSSGANRGVNFDTGAGTDYVIRGNIFHCPANSYGLLIGCGVSGIIENNVIELTGTNSTALVMSGSNTNFPCGGVTNCIARNNAIINRSQDTNNSAISFWTSSDWPQHSTFENNRIDSSLKFYRVTSLAGFWFNNTDFDGNNLSGLPFQTARNVVANKP